MNFYPLDNLNKADIAVVGEYTTSGGPMFDDWFIVLVCKNGDRFDYPISFSHQIAQKMEIELDFRLANKTDERSRIIFPEQLKNKPVVEFKRGAFSLKKVLFLIRHLGIEQITTELSKEVQDYVANEPFDKYAK